MSKQPAPNFDSIESRRSIYSGRRMTTARKIRYFLLVPVLRVIIRVLSASYRIEIVCGAAHIDRFIKGETVCAPCHWHQHQIVGVDADPVLDPSRLQGLFSGFRFR